MSAKDIFDKAISLNEGDQLLIPCHDLRQQESMRVSLAHQRRYFLSNTAVNFDIVVSKVTREGNPFLLLGKKPRLDTGLVVSKDGTVRTVSLRPDPVTSIARDGLEIERIRAAMLQDGYSEEDINNYLSGGQEPPKNDTCLLKGEEP
jgi:hypothetical protein